MKSFDLRFLIHLVGDIHQPLHAITKVDLEKLKTDKGGNDFEVKNRGSGFNLHTYWDSTLNQYSSLKAPLSERHWDKLEAYVKDIEKEFPLDKFTK